MKTIFENQVTTTRAPEEIKEFLTQAGSISHWAQDIADIRQIDEKNFRLQRREENFNGAENLIIETGNQSVSYEITGNRFSYRIIFDLAELASGISQITEHVVLEKEGKLNLFLKLMAPVLAKEFYKNLVQLALVLEN